MELNTKLNPSALSSESNQALLRLLEVLLTELPHYGTHPSVLYALSDYRRELIELLPMADARSDKNG